MGGRDELCVPVIDLSCSADQEDLVEQIASACAEYGFFQVVGHGISQDLIRDYREQFQLYFALPEATKQAWKRGESNARGYFDDELTKQRRDWKCALDFGVPGSRDWTTDDKDPINQCLDGWNQLPSTELLPLFRSTVTKYFDACAELSDRIAILMAKGLGQDETANILHALREKHSSYLRTNYYPPCNEIDGDGGKPLGISPHQDAGFLTVLLQDDDCHSLQVLKDDKWITVHPEPGAFTINTGDMAQVWSNDKYKAPLHRVLSDENKERYSSPFFYNPPYDTMVEPCLASAGSGKEDDETTRQYYPVLWGYFRAVRFAGDLTDLGVEIQIDHFRRGNTKPTSDHLQKQEAFALEADFSAPFSVEKYRPLLVSSSSADENVSDAQ
jgi:isopenicillin N synthase-like dioxygenase